MISKLYPTYVIMFDNLFELLTKIRFSNNYFEFIAKSPLNIGSNMPERKSITINKYHLNRVSLAGRLWPAYSGIWIPHPLIYLRLSKFDPL